MSRLKNDNIILRGRLKVAEQLNTEFIALLKSAKIDGVQEMVDFDISFATDEILSYLEELRDRNG